MCYIHISPEMKIQSEYFWCPDVGTTSKGADECQGELPVPNICAELVSNVRSKFLHPLSFLFV